MSTVDTLLKEYRNKNEKTSAKHLDLVGITDQDIYNITAPFRLNGKEYIAGRVEKRDSEHSKVYFFYKNQSQWVVDETVPVYDLQDPFVTFIKDELVFGGVEIFAREDDPTALDWRTVFYKGTDLNDMRLLFEGPIGMKDIRLKELPDNRILVLTRPQGEIGGRGTIGVVIIPALDNLTIDIIENAHLLNNLYIEDEWGGANECHIINENVVGILGHIAKFDENGDRHYYPITFELNVDTLATENLMIIAERKDFLPGPSKRPDLEDVVFSGGLSLQDENAILYAGVSDAEAQKIMIQHPFI